MKTANRKAVRYQGSLVFCNSAAKDFARGGTDLILYDKMYKNYNEYL